MDISVFMGHSPAKIDEKGRLKIPATFRKILDERYGAECFITSTDGERALVYPLPVWFEFQSRLAKVPSTSMAKARLLDIQGAAVEKTTAAARAADEYVHDNPWPMIGAAALFGFVLGLVVRDRD